MVTNKAGRVQITRRDRVSFLSHHHVPAAALSRHLHTAQRGLSGGDRRTRLGLHRPVAVHQKGEPDNERGLGHRQVPHHHLGWRPLRPGHACDTAQRARLPRRHCQELHRGRR
jgi:hypothetical protein